MIEEETGTWDLDEVVEDAHSGLDTAAPCVQARRRLVGSVSATERASNQDCQGSYVHRLNLLRTLPCMLSILVSA